MLDHFIKRFGPKGLGFIIAMGVLSILMLFAIAIVANDLVLIGSIHHFESVIRTGHAQRVAAEAKQAAAQAKQGLRTCKAFQTLDNSIKGVTNINKDPNGLGNRLSAGIHSMFTSSGCSQLLGSK